MAAEIWNEDRKSLLVEVWGQLSLNYRSNFVQYFTELLRRHPQIIVIAALIQLAQQIAICPLFVVRRYPISPPQTLPLSSFDSFSKYMNCQNGSKNFPPLHRQNNWSTAKSLVTRLQIACHPFMQ